jgi:holliday junction DNA helicase RuvA
MIAHLEGVLREKSATRAIVAVGGVGYEVHVSLTTFGALPDTGKSVSLRIHTHVREDAIQLFGFHTDLERALFEQLIRTSGVGPKLAQAVLSGMLPRDLLAALMRDDLAALRTIPGIGLKTAQRLLVDLRDRVGDLAAAAAADGGAVIDAATPAPDAFEEVVSALVNLGTQRVRAERVAREVADEIGEAETGIETWVRAALRRLSR